METTDTTDVGSPTSTNTSTPSVHVPSLHQNHPVTVAIAMGMFSVGWLYGLLGPSLPDLQLLTGTNLQQVSLLLTMQGVGRGIGGLVNGFLYDHIDRKLILFSLLALCGALTTATLPWSHFFPVFLTIMVVCGFCVGGITCGGNTIVASCGGHKTRQFMQFIHFSYALGGVISPLVASPFFSKLVYEPLNITHNSSELHSVEIQPHYKELLTVPSGRNDTNFTELMPSEVHGMSHVFVPFSLTAGVFLITGLWTIYVLCSKRSDTTTSNEGSIQRNNAKESHEKSDTSSAQRLTRRSTIVCLFFVVILRLSYAPIELGQLSYLTSFVTRQLNWTVTRGAVLTSLLWAALCFGRLAGIVVAKYLHPTCMVYVSLAGILISSAGQFVGGYFKMEVLLWVSVPFSGIFMSVVSPTTITWVNENVTAVSGKVAAIFAVSTSTSVLLFPLYIGYLIENVSNMWYVYIQIAQCVSTLVVFTILVVVVKQMKRMPTTSGDGETEPLLGDNAP